MHMWVDFYIKLVEKHSLCLVRYTYLGINTQSNEINRTSYEVLVVVDIIPTLKYICVYTSTHTAQSIQARGKFIAFSLSLLRY